MTTEDTAAAAEDDDQAELYARIDQAGADAAAALRRLAELVHGEAEMGSRVRVLGALAREPGGPLETLSGLFADLAADLREFEHEDADIAADDLEQARADLGPVFEYLNSALDRARDLA